MKKSEFIARYGVEKYERRIALNRMKRNGLLPPEPPKKEPETYSFIIPVDVKVEEQPWDTATSALFRDAMEEEAANMQHELRKAYKCHQPRQHILIVSPISGRKKPKMKIELYQFDITDEDKRIIREAAEEYKG